ncbi:hypothetical protein nbrc107696_10050 [Gordonia spumicola]|uniref:Uncharacterized protein n=1 Tax=Gordonia spumicola TaxID=589161 RepID=A0A7I9V572_9ACTN|nr:hypothetical protein [Gordonia spumicola]GEE00559.1 hypothetical protein nbrc107696_10050 [Gordonia spumicola]
MTEVPLRLVVTGGPDVVAAAVGELSSSFGHVVQAGPTDFEPGDLWAAVGESLSRFDRRICAEARHTSFVSSGSVLDDWTALNRRLSSEAGVGRGDARFARRYLRMHRETSIRHARTAYDAVVVIGDALDPDLSDLIAATDLTLVTHPPTTPASLIIDELGGTP